MLASVETAFACDWPEPGGGPLNNFATSDVEPPRTAPVERWRVQFDELLGEPVVSGGVVVVTRDHYRGETKAGSWTKLGFDSVRLLEAAYLVFLRNPSAGG